jgi:dynein heavy chain
MRKFEDMFKEKENKWIEYNDGEALFGLPITNFPELQITR